MTTPRQLMQELAAKADFERSHKCPERFMDRGTEIPDEFLPGRFIAKLSAEKREILSRLKSDDIKDCLEGEALIGWYMGNHFQNSHQ